MTISSKEFFATLTSVTSGSIVIDDAGTTVLTFVVIAEIDGVVAVLSWWAKNEVKSREVSSSRLAFYKRPRIFIKEGFSVLMSVTISVKPPKIAQNKFMQRGGNAWPSNTVLLRPHIFACLVRKEMTLPLTFKEIKACGTN